MANDNFIYLKVPYEYICIHNKLLTLLSNYGEEALRECNTECKQSNKNIIKCWNMFQAAIAAKAIGEDKKANVLISYINAQLEDIFKKDKEDIVFATTLNHMSEDGCIYGTLGCKTAIEFYVHIDPTDENFEEGCLYVKYFNNNSKEIQFEEINDNNPNLLYK